MSVKLIKALGGQELKRAKDFCRKWQYFSAEDQVYFDHSDIRCMIYNYCYMTYQEDTSELPQHIFEIANYQIDFKQMTEKNGSEVRKIRRVEESHIRMR